MSSLCFSIVVNAHGGRGFCVLEMVCLRWGFEEPPNPMVHLRVVDYINYQGLSAPSLTLILGSISMPPIPVSPIQHCL